MLGSILGLNPRRKIILPQAGFTLLEVMVAFLIFAIVGLGAHQFLRNMINTRDVTHERNTVISSTSRAFTLMQRDFSHLVDRQVRSEYGESMPPLLVGNGDYSVEFSRSGWNNPARLARSNLQRVAYALNDDGELQRHFWLVMDRAEDSEPITQTLIADIEDFRINVMGRNGDFTDVWPDFNSTDRLPRAVEVIVTHEKLGELRKIFNVVMTADVSQSQANSGGIGNLNTQNQTGSGNTAGSKNNTLGAGSNAPR
ncbi:MAG: general secretion pathway protein J [Candidatus Azotimanducaceae bacterium]|jgi:general secretion pathway protein J